MSRTYLFAAIVAEGLILAAVVPVPRSPAAGGPDSASQERLYADRICPLGYIQGSDGRCYKPPAATSDGSSRG